MRDILRRIPTGLGYEIRRVPKAPLDVRFLQSDRFEVGYTPLEVCGDRYFVPSYASHRPAVRDLLGGVRYEPATHDFVHDFCGTFGGSIVHAGTFFGDMLPDFSRAVSGNVYAFEPVLENYILARLCVDRNDLLNVVLMNAALSDGLGALRIDTSDGGKHAGGSSTISDNGAICVGIDIDRLAIDDLVLIQLDVEGHELAVLKGAQTTIKNCRPVITVEDNNGNCSDLLGNIKYEFVGEIPGLKIWTPVENRQYRERLLSFLSRT